MSPIYVQQKLTVEDLLLIADSQIAAGDLAGATSTLIERLEIRIVRKPLLSLN